MKRSRLRPGSAIILDEAADPVRAPVPGLCEAVIFDLDGTLLDSLVDLSTAVNQALVALAHPPHPTQSYRRFIGDGMSKLVERALPASHRRPVDIHQCSSLTLQWYDRCWDHNTRPYPGVPQLLDSLTERHMPVAVLTNKPQKAAQKVVDKLLPHWPFHTVIGTGPGVPDKPDPTGALSLATTLGVDPWDCVYVGDSGADMQTACRAGMFAVGATWGFRTASELAAAGVRHLLNSPEELEHLLGAQRALPRTDESTLPDRSHRSISELCQ